MRAKRHVGSHEKWPWYLSDFNQNLNVSANFNNPSPISNFMKVSPAVLQFVHASRYTTDMAKLMSSTDNFFVAEEPKLRYGSEIREKLTVATGDRDITT
jgi:hypothetical protein